MFTDALLILAPLFFGFLFTLQNRTLTTVIHYSVEALVYFILAILGLGLGQMEGLWGHLGTMVGQVAGLVLALLVANMLALWGWHCWQPMNIDANDKLTEASYGRLFMAAVKPLAAVIAGVFVGVFLLPKLQFVDEVATGALMLLLFFIGLQLRNAGLSLRRLLMNRQGLGIAVVVMLSSLLAGLLIAPFYDLPVASVLALASGLGWYSLSGIVIGDALGPAWGGVAFLNDVFREIIALAVIPMVISARPALAIGYGGATSMDFTLPIIRSSGGLSCVPVAIASGFILSFAAPILMGLFLSLG